MVPGEFLFPHLLYFLNCFCPLQYVAQEAHIDIFDHALT